MAYRRTEATQQRLDTVKASIVDAALALIAERGYADCQVAVVADAAGVATGTVYRHFPNKGALFAEVFRVATTREVEAVREAATKPGTLTERASAAVRTFANRALKSPRLAYALLAEPVDPLVEKERLLFRRAYRDIFASAIADAVDAGELPRQDPEVTAAAVVGAIAEALVVPLAAGTGSRRTVPALEAVVIRAIGGTDDHA
ncbi:TetR family transcriptional regulator [Herbihabitans rhizosphaerae]|uniref:TetR family transcriptional regulator n=1 Tax=Herbihabitans rhizosphaerae TaxID=1872711 RepID=A0A4Q7KLQ7_9PSEU|nr:TetR/AcrR family transcriptional regulator [Herbihabitans rhizosphaerae]RZS36491.1 TetR family transcriptional regulator [Herbihabitans rhizosphaerae]